MVHIDDQLYSLVLMVPSNDASLDPIEDDQQLPEGIPPLWSACAMDDPYTNSREVEDIMEESSTVRIVFNRHQNGHMIDNSRK